MPMHQQKAVTPLTPVISPEQQSLNAISHLRDALSSMGDLRQSLSLLQKNGFCAMPETRSVKIQRLHRFRRFGPDQIVPILSFNGNWLTKAGFDCHQQVRIVVIQGMLVIFPEKPEQTRKRRV